MWDTIIITPFVNILLFIYNLVAHNFGLAIILFTLLIRLLTHPLTASQVKSSSAMTAMQSDKRWLAAQKKYKDDKEKLAAEQMKLYKELGVNPLGSCLPTLIQFPIIIGLYQSVMLSLANSPLELLNLIKHIYPGFINVASIIPLNSQFLWMNLGQPERVNIPGIPFGIPVLAIIVLVTTYLQSKVMTPPPASGDSNDQAAQMTKMMNIYMPFMMGYLALTFSAGLSVYFVASNVIGILQYAILGKVNWKNILPSFLKKEDKTK
jgi:YidC/Oxa1 family membrane protein insertase